MVKRRWWAGRSWRARAGWVLLGGALAVLGVALPVWALAGDVNAVAGWANVLALPVSAAGLVLLLADRDRDGVAVPAPARRPWMAPPLDRMVERPELGGRLVAALMELGPAMVGLTTGLHGAGGFGKTRLATWACHRPEISRQYPGGLLWVTVGQEVREADLAVRINDLAFTLCGQRPAISEPDAAGAELGRLLDERDPVLLVIDDVWEQSQLRPFRFGGRCCTRLVTTRIPDLLPDGGARIAVDAMSDEQARELLADGVAGLPAEVAGRLTGLAGRWPVLLNLINSVLRSQVARGQPAVDAAADTVRRLVSEGPAVLDPAQPGDRSRAVAATVEASLALLEPADRHRYLDLAIFPEDVDIPLPVLGLLWPGCRVEAFAEQLAGLGLAADYRLDPPGPRLVLHDVLRAYLQTRRSTAERAAVHQQLIDAAAGLLPAGHGREPVPWWLLPDDAGASYLWRYLAHHLHQAGQAGELAELVCDLRWVQAKTARFGSAVTLEGDLQLVDTPTSRALRRALGQAAHLLGPIGPPAALGATLASRLYGVPELPAVLDRYRATLPRPRLEPAWPLPDQPDPATTRDGHAGAVQSCAFSPDGTLLATVSDDRTARLWQVADGTERRVLIGHTGGVWDCAFSPDGILLATASDDRTVRLWQVADGTAHAVLVGHADWVTGCVLSPDGTVLATASRDGTVRLWHVADGTTHTVLYGHTGGAWHCAFSPDGTLLATASSDGIVRLWRIPEGCEHGRLTGHNGIVRGCAFSPDGSLLATSGDDGTVRLWHVADSTQHAMLTAYASLVRNCAFSPDGTLLAATSSTSSGVRLWRVADGTEHAVLTGHTHFVQGCAFSPDSTLIATASVDQTARLWRVADGTEHAVLTGHTGRTHGCAFSPDGTLLATARYDQVPQLWRVADGTEHAVLTGHGGRTRRCAFSPDGTLLAASDDRTARLWQVADGTEQAVLTGHTDLVRCCAFSPDGTVVATGGYDQSARLWQVADGTERKVLTGHTGAVECCAFSPDGTLLATVGWDQTARLWRVADGTEHAVLTGHAEMLNDCAFSPDGALLATVSDDRTVRLWRVADGTEHAVLTGHTSWAHGCAFSPDGTLLATAGNDGTRAAMADHRPHLPLRDTRRSSPQPSCLAPRRHPALHRRRGRRIPLRLPAVGPQRGESPHGGPTHHPRAPCPPHRAAARLRRH